MAGTREKLHPHDTARVYMRQQIALSSTAVMREKGESFRTSSAAPRVALHMSTSIERDLAV